jgi:hypothetical protein
MFFMSKYGTISGQYNDLGFMVFIVTGILIVVLCIVRLYNLRIEEAGTSGTLIFTTTHKPIAILKMEAVFLSELLVKFY